MAELKKRFAGLTDDWDHGLVMLGVGAAFDFLSDRKIQAPRWIQRSGFEWLFRAVMEPRRLAARYAKSNTRFIGGILKQMTR